MSFALFDAIHDSVCFCTRTEPATMEEFLEFGLQPEDYVRYVGLQLRLQGELMLYGFPKRRSLLSDINKTTYPALDELISFCKEKKLIAEDNCFDNELYVLNLLDRSDAEYYHGWLRYPKDTAEFRLTVERKLSTSWDEEDTYVTETYGLISFVHDNYTETANGIRMVDIESPIRVRRYDVTNKKFEILKYDEVKALYELAQNEKSKIDQEIDDHLAKMPSEQNVAAISNGLPWVKKMFALTDRQEMIENVFDDLCEAIKTPDIYKFKDSDILFVVCGEDACAEDNHLLSDIKVEFSFDGKPDKQYTIQRCAHCKQYRISLINLYDIFDNYGVMRGIIVYDDDSDNDFSDFAETSVFYRMGYTVSQSAGLSAAKRQYILKKAIESGKASKRQVLSFLKQRMNINGTKAGNEIAFRKWKEDYDFISKVQE